MNIRFAVRLIPHKVHAFHALECVKPMKKPTFVSFKSTCSIDACLPVFPSINAVEIVDNDSWQFLCFRKGWCHLIEGIVALSGEEKLSEFKYGIPGIGWKNGVLTVFGDRTACSKWNSIRGSGGGLDGGRIEFSESAQGNDLV